MYSVIEKLDAAGDNFWNFNSTSTSNFDMLPGDALLTSVFKPHADYMASKNKVPVSKPLEFDLLTPVVASTGVSTIGTFKWGQSLGASTYSIIVADNASFTTPVINVSGLTSTAYKSVVDLALIQSIIGK